MHVSFWYVVFTPNSQHYGYLGSHRSTDMAHEVLERSSSNCAAWSLTGQAANLATELMLVCVGKGVPIYHMLHAAW